MVNMVKSPRVSANDFQKSLAHAVIIVGKSTGKTLNKNGVHGRSPRREPLVSKKNPHCCKRRHLLEWPSQSPDLNPIEVLSPDLRRAIHSRHPKNIAELKQFCRDEWSKVPPARCSGQVCNCRKCLVDVLAAKGGSTSY